LALARIPFVSRVQYGNYRQKKGYRQQRNAVGMHRPVGLGVWVGPIAGGPPVQLAAAADSNFTAGAAVHPRRTDAIAAPSREIREERQKGQQSEG
jgi:hypothetical protein